MISSAITTTSSSSVIFPTVPILSATSIVLCLLILPRFWKTRIFAVVYHICWLIAGNALLLINTSIWRGNVRSIPIYCDIAAIFWSGYSRTLYMCILCVNKFIWTISKPAPSVRVYDGRKRTNVIDAFICVVLPLLFYPFEYFLFTARYLVVEDIGPWPLLSFSIGAFLVDVVPLALCSLVSIGFNCAACYNFWHPRHKKPHLDYDGEPQYLHRLLSTSQRWKYTLMCITTFCGTIYGTVWVLLRYTHVEVVPLDPDRWYKAFGLKLNPSVYKTIHVFTREELGLAKGETKRNLYGFAFTLPLVGIHMFLFFGLGSEARKAYMERFQAILKLINDTRLFGWLKAPMEIARTRLDSVVGKIAWRRGRHPMETNAFTPFEAGDIILDDLSTAWHSMRMPPLPLPIVPPASSSLKRSQVTTGPIPLWREYRKELLLLGGNQEGGERDAQQQPAPSSKARLLQAQPAYVVYRKSPQ
ncbi:a-factor receptor [Serendipita sp. 401]|nr:a-factor receptor [Serendipita sp. 401]